MEAEHVSKEPPEPGKSPPPLSRSHQLSPQHMAPAGVESQWFCISWLFSSGQAFKAGQGFMPVGQAQYVRPLFFPQLTSPWQGSTLLSQGNQCFTQHLRFYLQVQFSWSTFTEGPMGAEHHARTCGGINIKAKYHLLNG